MISRLEQAHAGRQNSSHAGSGSHALLRTFQRSQTLFKHGDRGIGEPRINVARFFSNKTFGGLFGIVEHKAGSEKQRLAVLVKLTAFRACAQRQCFRLIFFF